MVDAINTGESTDTSQTAAPEGHDQAMSDKVDQSQEAVNSPDTSTSGESGGGEEGEKILGKFNSQEELAEAYRELEAKLSGNGESGSSEGQSQEQSQEELDQAAREAVDKAEGVDMKSLSQEYSQNGELAEESYKALEDAGIPRDMVDQFIEGQEARAAQTESRVKETVGGEDQFNKVVEWASSNLSQEQIDAYNTEVNSGDPTRMEQAAQALAYQYSQAKPQEPTLVGGEGQGKGSDGFQSVAELTEAMKDPRYHKDPAYRKDVERRLASSSVL